MSIAHPHTFHIPVMGLGYTVDSPLKVARFGIDSVVSIIQDHLLDQLRGYYCHQNGLLFEPIPVSDPDHRAKRITAYLNLMQMLIDRQLEVLRNEPFEDDRDIMKYFRMLPESSPEHKLFDLMLEIHDEQERSFAQKILRGKIRAGSIDVNIMTKLDNLNSDKDGNLLPPEFADAMAALRGYAQSCLDSSIVFSAGLNPRLFAYCETFPDFFPDAEGHIRKRIILKVSDVRSALVQGKYLAKKGLWVSEFRIESGLNCGGHAFPTDGLLMGPILEEFREKRVAIREELLTLCNNALRAKGKPELPADITQRITVQGGIGTAEEDRFLREHYHMDGTGWGSPFLLVPEATNVDDVTIRQLASAKREDYFISFASPLGIPFNNFRKSSAESQRHERIEKNRPGSPCYKKYLSFNTEFTDKPICTSSRAYQNYKLAELKEKGLSEEQFTREFESITAKDCLCEGLSSSVLLKYKQPVDHHLEAVTICPGPNLAYFSGIFSLEEMVGHIYGRTSVLNDVYRPHMFIQELNLYIDYFRKEIEKLGALTDKQEKHYATCSQNIQDGINYYRKILPLIAGANAPEMQRELATAERQMAEVFSLATVSSQ